MATRELAERFCKNIDGFDRLSRIERVQKIRDVQHVLDKLAEQGKLFLCIDRIGL